MKFNVSHHVKEENSARFGRNILIPAGEKGEEMLEISPL